MRVLVTGASGFVGRGLCDTLQTRGHDVGRVLRSPDAALRVDSIDGHTDWTEILSAFAPDAVVHCAARVHVVHESDDRPLDAFRKVNVDGTANLARQARAAGVRRFVFLSSIKVHGELSAPGRPFVETDVPAPVDPYGQSKLEAELALADIAAETGLEVVTVRPPLVYGPGVGANFRSLFRLVERGLPLPFASVDNRRSYVSRTNLCDFIVRCLEHPDAPGKTFLVSDHHDLSLPDTVRMIAGAQGVRARLIPVPERWLKTALGMSNRAGLHDKLCGWLQVDPSHGATTLDWHPPETVEAGFASVVAGDA